MPYNHQQQIIPIAHANGYQFAAIPHQQVQVSQPYSYVTSAPSDAGKVISIKIVYDTFVFKLNSLSIIDCAYTKCGTQ